VPKEICRWCTHRNPVSGECKKINEAMKLDSNLQELMEQGHFRAFVEERYADRLDQEDIEDLIEGMYDYFTDELKVTCVVDTDNDFKCRHYQ